MADPKRVLITGAAGQLGSTVASWLRTSCEVRAVTRSDLDISDPEAVLAASSAFAPDAIVNCAAYNDVEGAEEDAAGALSGNALGVRSLARAAAETGAVLVHYGTDFIFDGNTDRPYTEDDPPRPLSVYGASKLLGEWFALEAPAAYVLRVESLFGGTPAKSSIDKILAAIEKESPVRVFEDRTVTPSFVEDVAAATARLLSLRPPAGVYHCVNSGVTTWRGIAEEACRILRRRADVVPVASESLQLRAKRPRYCGLSNQKLADVGISMPPWQDALQRHISNR